MIGPAPGDHVWWLASRAAGITALLAVTISVLIGLLLATRLHNRPKLNRTLMSLHEHTALVGLLAIAVHGLTLLGDPWLRPGLSGILVPFAMDYRPLFTGLGVIAGLLAALLGLSFYARRRIGAKLWRRAHRWTLAVYVLGVVHTLGAGTDASTAWMRALLVGCSVPVLFLALVRLAGGPRRRPEPIGKLVATGVRPRAKSTR